MKTNNVLPEVVACDNFGANKQSVKGVSVIRTFVAFFRRFTMHATPPNMHPQPKKKHFGRGGAGGLLWWAR